MELMDAILTRRSIRQYTGELISDDQLAQILRAGSYAPSAHDRRPWHFVVLRDPAGLEALAKVHPYAKMAPQAGTAVVVCGDLERQRELGFLVEDCSAVIQNMLLAARGLGLGAVWCGLHPIEVLVEGARALLGLPPTVVPVGLVVLGHSAENRVVAERFDPNRVHRDRW